MGCVGTSIIGRPRPLAGTDAPTPHYTLKGDEPENCPNPTASKSLGRQRMPESWRNMNMNMKTSAQ
jgi:hypothetical protein